MPTITKEAAERLLLKSLKKHIVVEEVIVSEFSHKGQQALEVTVFYEGSFPNANFTVSIYSFNSSLSFQELSIAAEAKAKSISCKKTTLIKF